VVPLSAAVTIMPSGRGEYIGVGPSLSLFFYRVLILGIGVVMAIKY